MMSRKRKVATQDFLKEQHQLLQVSAIVVIILFMCFYLDCSPSMGSWYSNRKTRTWYCINRQYLWKSHQFKVILCNEQLWSCIFSDCSRLANSLESSQYLEQYLWPFFNPEIANKAFIISMVLMVNEKFKERVPAWKVSHHVKGILRSIYTCI